MNVECMKFNVSLFFAIKSQEITDLREFNCKSIIPKSRVDKSVRCLVLNKIFMTDILSHKNIVPNFPMKLLSFTYKISKVKDALTKMSAKSLTPTYFNIKFENNNLGIFNPGDTINGIVELYVEKRIKKTKGLKLEVTGIANCAWTKRKLYKIVKYEGTQKFMEHVSYFFGRVDGAAIEVSVGVHLYKFSCQIPNTAASSYEGINGSIKYSVKVTLDIPFMHDIVYEKPFTVLRYENLNDFPWLRCKSDSETDVSIGIDCCETMPLVISIKIDKTGFAVGETLKVRIEACNQGPAKYSNSSLTLYRSETCASQFPMMSTKKVYMPVSYVPSKSIKPFESTLFEESLIIPKEIYGSSPVNNETVRIGYIVRFCTKSNRRTTVQTDLSVFIGHVPLKDEPEDEEEFDSQSEPIEDSQKKDAQNIQNTNLPECSD